MRPLPGDDALTGRLPGANYTDNETPSVTGSRQSPQMTYFMTDERTIESSQTPSSGSSTGTNRKRENPKANSQYGVESMETTIGSLSPSSSGVDVTEHATYSRKNDLQHVAKDSDEQSIYSDLSSPKRSNTASRTASPSHHRRSSQATISRPFTPLSYSSLPPDSVAGSFYSRRSSDAESLADELASQAIMSSDEGEEELSAGMADSGSAPQLIMPSIKMPSRRPFTERGKAMSRFKMLIAGDSGVGKTSLIKAIVQCCEDVVHVDPLSSSQVSIPDPRHKHSKSKPRSGSANITSTSQITEVYASTKAYPAWWSDMDDSKILRRRKSVGDSVLERNLCFVDTPGYGKETSFLESISPVLDYIESHFQKITNMQGIHDSDIINMLSGNGGTQVDVVFYVIVQRIKPTDIEYLRRISALTNVVPILAHADKLTEEHRHALKANILSELQAVNIRPFLFGLSVEGALQSIRPTVPYAISAATGKDHENMDASVLMSPDYVQPLLESELASLVEQILEPSTMSWLRHSAAKKYIQWRNKSAPSDRPQSLYRPMSMSSSLVSSQTFSSSVGGAASYALARITDHTQREERLTQVRLANWAADLQRSLQNERARFEALARNDRAVWLAERLGECVQDGTIAPISQLVDPSLNESSSVLVKKGVYSPRYLNRSTLNPRDPLGLLDMSDEMRRRGRIALQIVSGFGIIGGLAFWMARVWHSDGDSGFRVLDWTGLGLLGWA